MLATDCPSSYLRLMVQPRSQPDPAKIDTHRTARLAEEERLLREAEESVERVGTVPADEVYAWLRSLGTLPRPVPRQD